MPKKQSDLSITKRVLLSYAQYLPRPFLLPMNMGNGGHKNHFVKITTFILKQKVIQKQILFQRSKKAKEQKLWYGKSSKGAF